MKKGTSKEKVKQQQKQQQPVTPIKKNKKPKMKDQMCDSKSDSTLQLKPKIRHVVKPDRVASQEKALQYLENWKRNNKSWKFEKIRQSWLMRYMFYPEKIPDDNFSVLVDYFAGSHGNVRRIVLSTSESITQSMRQWMVLKEKGLSDENIKQLHPHIEGVDEVKYYRAKLICQALGEN